MNRCGRIAGEEVVLLPKSKGKKQGSIRRTGRDGTVAFRDCSEGFRKRKAAQRKATVRQIMSEEDSDHNLI